MKKIYLIASGVVIAACLTFLGSISALKTEENSLLIDNIEALAAGHGEGESTANKKCPIWTVEVKTDIGTGNTGTSITCTTGGNYQCESGTCPHK